MGLILPQMEGAGSFPVFFFFSASASAVSFFDCSELAGVLILEELVYREENCSPADIYVPAVRCYCDCATYLNLCMILG